jgi:hypothetical protein
MGEVVAILIAVAAVVAFVWIFGGSIAGASGDAPIDATDARTIGTLVGLCGGSVADAAVAQAALRRFEEIHGRKATVREMGIVVGLMKTPH